MYLNPGLEAITAILKREKSHYKVIMSQIRNRGLQARFLGFKLTNLFELVKNECLFNRNYYKKLA